MRSLNVQEKLKVEQLHQATLSESKQMWSGQKVSWAPGEVFQACPFEWRPRGRLRTQWQGYISRLARKPLGIPVHRSWWKWLRIEAFVPRLHGYSLVDWIRHHEACTCSPLLVDYLLQLSSNPLSHQLICSVYGCTNTLVIGYSTENSFEYPSIHIKHIFAWLMSNYEYPKENETFHFRINHQVTLTPSTKHVHFLLFLPLCG